MNARYTRLFADADGESHFEDVEAELSSVEFAPTAPPLEICELGATQHAAFFGARAGWSGDWHPAAARNLFVVISGKWEVEASDGVTKRFGPHSVLLVEDTTGKGHRSRVVSDEGFLALLVQLT